MMKICWRCEIHTSAKSKRRLNIVYKNGEYFFHDALKLGENYYMMFLCDEIIEEIERDRMVSF
jgi:hypothetical protein